MPAVLWWRVFPGDPAELRLLRRWIAGLFPPSPVRDDVIEVVCELAGNAICHTRSGQGGKFGVQVEHTPGVVRVTVADGGSEESEPRIVADPLGEHGRGLRIVHALAAQVTVTGGKQGRRVRADVPWMERPGSSLTTTARLSPYPRSWRTGKPVLPGLPNHSVTTQGVLVGSIATTAIGD
jgi:serine/threonine-protein kinase RsbW